MRTIVQFIIDTMSRQFGIDPAQIQSWPHLSDIHDRYGDIESNAQAEVEIRRRLDKYVAKNGKPGSCDKAYAIVTSAISAMVTNAFEAESRSTIASERQTLESWRITGATLWPYTYQRTSNDREALKTAIDEMARIGQTNQRAMELFHRLQTTAAVEMMAIARWAHEAFPVVQLAGHKYAAALMATNPDWEADIRPPWNAFAIQLQPGLLAFADTRGVLSDATAILVHHNQFKDAWTWNILVRSHTAMLTSWGKSTKDLSLDDEEDDGLSPCQVEMDRRDKRTIAAACRLVMNVCLALSDPGEVRPVGTHPKGWTQGPGRKTKEPMFRKFCVGHPVTVDCRPALNDYFAGRRSTSPTVQFLVRGHWRNQACGPGLSQRRRQWIEPFWKGPEDALINVRPHRVTPDQISK